MPDRRSSQSVIRVRYAETDAMGIVHHTAYIVWFEVGRSEWMRQRGSSYAAFEASGYLLPVSEVGARYLMPARYDEMVVIRTWVAELKSRKLRFNYEIVRQSNGELLVTGFTTHIVTDHSGRVKTFPAEVRKLLDEAIN